MANKSIFTSPNVLSDLNIFVDRYTLKSLLSEKSNLQKTLVTISVDQNYWYHHYLDGSNFSASPLKALTHDAISGILPLDHFCHDSSGNSVIIKSFRDFLLRRIHTMRLVVHNPFEIHWFENYFFGFSILAEKKFMIQIASCVLGFNSLTLFAHTPPPPIVFDHCTETF